MGWGDCLESEATFGIRFGLALLPGHGTKGDFGRLNHRQYNPY
jgi:hypothetical protein